MKMLLDGSQRTQAIESFKQDKFTINKNAKPFNGIKLQERNTHSFQRILSGRLTNIQGK